jgi:hypothetical protein
VNGFSPAFFSMTRTGGRGIPLPLREVRWNGGESSRREPRSMFTGGKGFCVDKERRNTDNPSSLRGIRQLTPYKRFMPSIVNNHIQIMGFLRSERVENVSNEIHRLGILRNNDYVKLSKISQIMPEW